MLREKPAPVPLCRLPTPHALWTKPQTSSAGTRRITAREVTGVTERAELQDDRFIFCIRHTQKSSNSRMTRLEINAYNTYCKIKMKQKYLM